MSKVLSIRVSDETAAEFEKQAAASGESKADYLTRLITGVNIGITAQANVTEKQFAITQDDYSRLGMCEHGARMDLCKHAECREKARKSLAKLSASAD